MKQLITIILMAVWMTAFSSNDDLVVSGYFENNQRVTIQVYQGNELVLEKKPIFNYYKLKLQPGEYIIYFSDNNNTKKLYLSIATAKTVQIDVDFNLKNDVAIEVTNNDKLNYRIIPKRN